MAKILKKSLGLMLAIAIVCSALMLPAFADGDLAEVPETVLEAIDEASFTAALAKANELGGEIEILLKNDFEVSYTRLNAASTLYKEGLNLTIRSSEAGVKRTVLKAAGTAHLYINGTNITVNFQDVVFDGGWERETQQAVWGGITIYDSRNITINGAYVTRCLGVSVGSSIDSGAPLRVVESTGVLIVDSVFEKSAALSYGTLAIDYSEVTFTGDTRISGNSVYGQGTARGGALGLISSKVTITGNTQIVDNYVDGDEPYPGEGDESQGGAIYLSADNTLIITEDAVISRNAAGIGGAIYSSGRRNYIEVSSRAKLTDNVARQQREREYNAMGAAIYMLATGEIMIKDNAEISGNSAYSLLGKATYGSAVTMQSTDSTLTIEGDAKIFDNEADYGGALYVMSSNNVILRGNAELTENRAILGGAVMLSGTTHLAMSGQVKINGNTAESEGGGLFLNSTSTAELTGGEMRGNTAGEYGGAISLNPARYANLVAKGVAFSGNTAAEAHTFDIAEADVLAIYKANIDPVSLSEPFDLESDDEILNKAYNNYDIAYEGEGTRRAVYTLEYRANNGTDACISSKHLEGTSISISEALFDAPEGMRFAGWKDSEGNVYEPGKLLKLTKDTVLYAWWEQMKPVVPDPGPEPAPEPKPQPAPDETGNGFADFPKTNDASIGFTVLALIALASVIVMFMTRRKKA